MSTVRFAILGTAKIARTVGPRIRSARSSELLGIASRSQDKAAAFALEFGVPKTYDSYQAALDDPDIDAVYIPLPPSMHLEWTVKAAAAGKHVLCEKPLATNADEVDQMIAACQQHSVVLLDGVMWYHTPRARELKELLDTGELGDLRQLTSVFTFRWDTMPMDNLRMYHDMGGGSLLDLGWYCVGAALWLFDEMPQQAFARASWCNRVDTRMNAFLWFANEKVATIECGFDAVRRRWLEVAGSRRTLFCDDFTRPWDAQKAGFRTLDNDGQREEYTILQRPQEELMIDAFCELIENGETDHEWLELARRTQAVCDVLRTSARNEQMVPLSQA